MPEREGLGATGGLPATVRHGQTFLPVAPHNPTISRFYGIAIRMLAVIQSVSVEPDCALRLTFADGVTGVVKLGRGIHREGVFRQLTDPTVFQQVKVGDRGRYLEWPGEIDLCADALWRTIHDAARDRATV